MLYQIEFGINGSWSIGERSMHLFSCYMLDCETALCARKEMHCLRGIPIL